MKPYNIYGCGINKWVDLDSVLEIEITKYGEMRYRLAFTDDYVYVKYDDEDRYNFQYECYEPFLKAWKNKDIINVEKKRISVDELLVSNDNLHEAVSILIQGISSDKSSYEILSSWDSFRRNDVSK